MSLFEGSIREALDRVEHAADAFEGGDGGTPELATIVSNLTTIWRLVERDPGLHAAALDVFEAASALCHPDRSNRTHVRRILRQALSRLRDRVHAARKASFEDVESEAA
jgi:hypothetical protein